MLLLLFYSLQQSFTKSQPTVFLIYTTAFLFFNITIDHVNIKSFHDFNQRNLHLPEQS